MMKKQKRFELLMKEAENDLLVLQKEACALQAAINVGDDAEAELKTFKQQWLVKEQILRTLATRNAIKCRNKIKQLRVKLRANIMQNKKAANTQATIFSCTSAGCLLKEVLKDVKCRRASFNRWLTHSSSSQLQEASPVHKQAFKLLVDIDILVKKVQKISKASQEVKSLKKAIGDVEKFLDSNQSLATHWFSKVTPSWDAMTLHFPQECSEKRSARKMDAQSVLNIVNTPNDNLKTQEDYNDAGVKSGHSCAPSQCEIIHNNCRYKEVNSKDSNTSSLKILPTKCFNMPVCKKNNAESYKLAKSVLQPSSKRKPIARKGTQFSFIVNSNPMFNYTIQHVARKKSKKNNSDFAGSYGDDRNHVSNGPNAEKASKDSKSINHDIDAILKEYEVRSPISNFENTSALSVNLDSTENNPSFEKHHLSLQTNVQEIAENSSKDRKSIDHDIDAILNEYEVKSPISNFENSSVLSVNLDSTENNPSFERHHLSLPTDVQQIAENASKDRKSIEHDIDAILNEYEVKSPISNFENSSVLSVNLESTENSPSFERHHLSLPTNVITEFRNIADICNFDKDNTEFRSDTREAFAVHTSRPSIVCPKKADNITVKRFNLSEKYVSEDSGKTVITHHSTQATYGQSMGSWCWTGQFSQGSELNDGGIQVLNLGECRIPLNDTIAESAAWVYKNSHVPRNLIADDFHTCTDQQFWKSTDYALNFTELSTVSSKEKNGVKNTQHNGNQNNSVEDFQKGGI